VVATRKKIGIALAVMASLAGVALFWHTPTPERATGGATAAARPQSSSPPADSPALHAAAGDPSLPPPTAGKPSAVDTAYAVNLDELKRRLPDNLYWTLGAPTKDADVLRQRAERKREENALYGKVLSTTATEEEIRSYYAERSRVSRDYIQFAELVLAEYRDQLPEEHIGLYEMSIRLNRARLEENPRDMEEALARLRAKQQR
jgi:hypothetical protein